MESTTTSTSTRTPAKTPRKVRSQPNEARRLSENVDPNVPVTTTSPTRKPPSFSSPVSATKSSKKQMTPRAPPPPKVLERKFVVARRNGKKGEDCRDARKAAYEALRASHEDFFKKKGLGSSATSVEESKPQLMLETTVLTKEEDLGSSSTSVEESKPQPQPQPQPQSHPMLETNEPTKEQDLWLTNWIKEEKVEVGMEEELQGLEGSTKVRKIRSIMMEEARRSIPEEGSGRVLHLVNAFERLLSLSKAVREESSGETGESKKKVMNWPLPGIQLPTGAPVSSISSSAEFNFPPNELKRMYSSTDTGSWRRLSSCSRASSEGGTRRNSSSGSSSLRDWSKKLKVTNQNPFKLRTEQRGRVKEEQFRRKVKEMIVEEEKRRIPVAQGLPWTTDEPEFLVKPVVKEVTEPIDLVLHSDMRALDRAEFDQYMEMRITLAEQKKMELERQRRLEEEEMMRKLRKELVPKAQPMPYFDRPFVPKRSTKPKTVPKEPRFHKHRSHNKCIPGDDYRGIC